MLKVLLLFVLLIAGIVVVPMIAGHGLCADSPTDTRYRNQRHGPGDYFDSGDGSAVCH